MSFHSDTSETPAPPAESPAPEFESDVLRPADSPADAPDAAEAANGAFDLGAADTTAVDSDTVDSDTVDSDTVDSDTVDTEVAEGEATADAETAAGETAPAETAEDGAVDAESLIEEPTESPYDRPGRWYVVHTQSGYEKKVKQNLEARTQSMNMEGRIHEVVIPTEDVIDFKGGKKVVVQKKVFPGYLLVRCRLDDDSWYVIRNTPGVTGFVGQGNKPSPLPRRDVEAFLQVKREGEDVAAKRSRPRLEFEQGETVRVKEGPFADFSGEIVEINEDQLKVKVLVNIFGRETPVELEFAQVAKL